MCVCVCACVCVCGGVLAYKSSTGMCHPILYGFFTFLVNGLKTLYTYIHFAHFGLESGVVFKGTTGVYEHIYHFNSK